MSYYKTCPDCGANLDPGERCDCQVDVSQLIQNDPLIKRLFEIEADLSRLIKTVSELRVDRAEAYLKLYGHESKGE